MLDAFGHVSVRHPDDPNRYFLSRSRAPGQVEPSDILEYDLDSKPARAPDVPLYSERVIHGEIYKARPDVMSVCHHHAPAFMPLCITGTDFVPVFHLGAVGGIKPPFWDQHDEFGDTNMLVVKPEEGASLARALGRHWMVLMKRHGVTVAGTSVRDTVRSARTIRAATRSTRSRRRHWARSCRCLAGRSSKCAAINTKTTGLTRAWEYWVARLEGPKGNRRRRAIGRVQPASRRRRSVPKSQGR